MVYINSYNNDITIASYVHFIKTCFFREKMHLKALSSLVKEDLWSCTRIYDDILFEYPLDSFALTMSYLTGLYTAQKDLMRNIPARVVAEYSKSDRFYG